MWDIYKTQIPLLTAIVPNRAVDLLESLIRVAEEEGNFPIGYRMARGADRFFRQGSALAHTALADVHALGLGDLDWAWALVHMEDDLRRNYGEDFFEHGIVHPITHTLDLAYAHYCTAKVARAVGDVRLAEELAARARRWVNAFEPEGGLLRDSEFYEGGKWNYSFRILHDMAARIALAGGDGAFVRMLDAFFGYDAYPVKQPGRRPEPEEMAAGYALNRFEGLNNEPDMEAPWAYHYAGRPDRTARGRARRADLAMGHRAGRPARATTTPAVSPPGTCGPRSGSSRSPARISSWSTPPRSPGPRYGSVTASWSSRRADTGSSRSARTASRTARRSSTCRAATFNGRPMDAAHLSAVDVHRGGVLQLELGPEPSSWGTHLRPPSVTPWEPRP